MSNNWTTGRWLAGILGLVLLLALVAPFVIYAVPEVIGADESYIVVSGSMQPTMNPGDVVIVTATPSAQIAGGDVITFTRPGESEPVTHRVTGFTELATGEEAFVTQGDNNEDPDGQPVAASQVVGVVTLTIPYIGYVIRFVNTQPGFVLLVAIPFALLVLNEAWGIVRSGRAENEASAGAAGADADAGADANAEIAAVDPAAVPGSDAFEFTRWDLRLTMVALAALAAYAGYILTLGQDTWAVMAFVATVGAFVLVVAIWYASPPPEPPVELIAGGLALSTGNRIARGELPASLRERPTVTVDSLADLVAMARASDGWILADGEEFFLPIDEVLYVAVAPVIGPADTAEAETETETETEDVADVSLEDADASEEEALDEAPRARADEWVDGDGDEWADERDDESGDDDRGVVAVDGGHEEGERTEGGDGDER